MSACLALLLLSFCAGGRPDITVKGVTFAPSGMMNGAVSLFMFIINNGSAGDWLTGCSVENVPAVRCELHDVRDGKMLQVEDIAIPAHGTTELLRGGRHIMLFDVPDESDESITLILSFKKSGPIETRAQKRNR